MTTRRKKALCALACALSLLLTGCISNMPAERQNAGGALPEARSGPEAPIGYRQSSRETRAVLYVPDADGTRLNATVETITITSEQTKPEAYVDALLQLINASDFYGGGQQIRLSPVSNAVETTRDIVTVNLHTSMRALTSEAQFALRMAITNTLTELSDTGYVNILVNGRDIGLDVEETIPTGVMERFPGIDVTTYWNQIEEQRLSNTQELQKMVTLYFVSSDGTSLLGEVRNLTFSQRDPVAYASLLLRELSKGAARIPSARTVVPENDWFARDPVLTQVEDGGTYIELHFRPETEELLARQGNTYAMLLTSICYTLTSFIPRLDGIIAYADGEMVTELTLMNGDPWGMQNGQLTRESVAALAADECIVYYPLASELRLCAVSLPIAQRLRTQPSALMRELMLTPEHKDLTRALPEAITDADILGLEIQGDTALLNVTKAFQEACAGMTDIQERNMIYAIVNTLTEIEGVMRVRFFVEGTQAPLAGHLYIPGEFLRHEGLIYKGFEQ